MNTTIMSGRLTKDPELRYTAGSGKAVCGFPIAVRRPYSKDTTDFFNVVVWNKPAEDAAKHLVRGQAVTIRGHMTNRSYDDKTGQKRYITELVAGEVEYGPRPGAGRSHHPEEPFAAEGFQQLEDDDDIPF